MDNGLVQIIIAIIGIFSVGTVTILISKKVRNNKDSNKIKSLNQTITGNNNNQAGRDLHDNATRKKRK